jgi:hypothetical protein
MPSSLARTGLAMITIAILIANGCAGPKSAGRDEVESDIKAALSLVSESKFFVEYLEAGRPPRPFATTHPQYLEEEIDKLAKSLEQTRTEPKFESAIENCKMLVKQLRPVVSGLQHDDPGGLTAAKATLESMQSRLRKTESEL